MAAAKNKKFIVIYHASAGAMSQMMKKTPEQMKEVKAAWFAWAKKCGKSLLDFGGPVGKGSNMSQAGVGPAKGKVIGYSFLQAKTLAEAKKMLKSHPHTKWHKGCSLEVYEVHPIPKK